MADHIGSEWWQGFLVHPQVAEVRIRLAVVEERVVMAQAEVVDPVTSELLGMKSHPALDLGSPEELVPLVSALVHDALSFLRGPFPT